MELNAKSFIWFKRLHSLLQVDISLPSSQELNVLKKNHLYLAGNDTRCYKKLVSITYIQWMKAYFAMKKIQLSKLQSLKNKVFP